MEQYKQDFIDYLLQTGALKIGQDFSLTSKRLSPYFINIGDFNDGESTKILGEAYANAIFYAFEEPEDKFDLLYGIPEKGVGIVAATSIGLTTLGINKPWFFTRKLPKEHGEMTNLTSEERKKLVVGRAPNDGDRLILLDDVFTTGDTKYESIETLNKVAEHLKYRILVIGVDRQEVGIDGKSAIQEFTEKTETPVISITNAIELYKYLRENSPKKLFKIQEQIDLLREETQQREGLGYHTEEIEFEIRRLQALQESLKTENIERIKKYLRVYGTKKAIEELGWNPDNDIINRQRSIIPACDVSTIEEFEDIVKNTADIDGIGGYKIGFELGLGYSLPAVVEKARKHTNKPLIYDHQKAGTDIPDTGKNFARVCKKAGVDAVIFFPQSGPETERAWIYRAFENDLKVLVGGEMTHPAYKRSEGGFISDDMLEEMYLIGSRAGVNNFVVPGNKVDRIAHYKQILEAEGINPTFFAPGFVAQGGVISEAGKAAGDNWHAIVGTGIYKAPDKRKAALEFTSQLG